jgi:hypothetical protein
MYVYIQSVGGRVRSESRGWVRSERRGWRVEQTPPHATVCRVLPTLREKRDVCERCVHPTPTVACVTRHATPGTLEWACVTDCGAAAAGRQTSVGLDDRSSQTSVAATHQTLSCTHTTLYLVVSTQDFSL